MKTQTKPKFKTKPWKHQRAAFDFALDKPATMLAMDMGTGKSKVAIDLAVNRGHRRILIVCPLAVVPVWPKQFALHADGFTICELSKGSIAKRMARAKLAVELADAREESLVIVINYEAAWRVPIDNWLKSVGFDLVILDESHRIKAPGGKSSWFCKAMGSKVRRRLCLTGTPMPHSPLDIYAQYRFLDTGIFGTSFQRFKKRYAIMGGFNDKQVVSFKNLDHLTESFYDIAYRVTKEEVLDLPPQVFHTLPFALSAKAMKIYQQMEDNFVAEVEAGLVTAGNALTKLLRLQQMTSGYVRVDDDEKEVIQEIDQSKAALLGDILQDLREDEPVVVFCRFIHDLDNVWAAAGRLGRECLELSGRKKELEAWQEGGAPILAVQIQAGGLGVDLTRACYAVYYSIGFSLGDYQQSLARIHRPGQERGVTYLHLVAQHTVDEKVMAALSQKENVIKGVLGSIGKR